MSTQTSGFSFFKSTIGRKALIALTGLFLISFLVVHVAVNAMIYFNDGGETFSKWAHFMGSNFIVRTIEIGLVAGLLAHVITGIIIVRKNKEARPTPYAYSNPKANSTWYSRSMGLLGVLILLFLVIHSSDFWIPNRANQFIEGEELDLFKKMQEVFSHWYMVVIYVGGCFALFWHLLHGFRSAFQSLGLNNLKYNQYIKAIGTAFAIIVPTLFATMPIAFYFNLIQ